MAIWYLQELEKQQPEADKKREAVAKSTERIAKLQERINVIKDRIFAPFSKQVSTRTCKRHVTSDDVTQACVIAKHQNPKPEHQRQQGTCACQHRLYRPASVLRAKKVAS